MAPHFADYYDAVVPWQKRLARELPLLEGLARQAGGRVLVPACGTGGHVLALAERGFDVLGFDIDEDALEVARRKIASGSEPIAAAGGKVELRLLDMADAADLGANFGCAFILGNALPGISEPGELAAALRGVAGALRPGGIFLTQNLNYDLRWREKTQYFPVLAGQTAKKEEVLLVKFAEYGAEFVTFHAIFLARSNASAPWESYTRSSKQVPLFLDRMRKLLDEAQLSGVRTWGDFQRNPFNLEKSNDLLIMATKTG